MNVVIASLALAAFVALGRPALGQAPAPPSPTPTPPPPAAAPPPTTGRMAPGAAVTLCPPEIRVEETAVAPGTGWTLRHADLPRRLAGVTFYDGPPEEKASLVYDGSREDGKVLIADWTFASNPRGFWIECGYDRTALLLARRLPDTVRRCTVRYARSVQVSGLPQILSIDCK